MTSLERLNLNLEIQEDLLAVLTLPFSFSLFTEGHSFIIKPNTIQDKANLKQLAVGVQGDWGRSFSEDGEWKERKGRADSIG